ncbi:MAG: amidohydrolase family protein [Armatimonadetes bacterium]|nr:amidohydrolase family protein [Armatimonadota bacterium]
MATSIPIIDCHVHGSSLSGIPSLNGICECVGIERMNIVCTTGGQRVNANPAALVTKAEFPERFYVFAGLDHSAHFSKGKLSPPSLPEQIDRLMALGADGIKMIEAKPTSRKSLPIPLDGPYFEEYFTHAEETGVPLLWHVADPEEFWDPDKTPSWAKQRGWGYNESFVPKEQLYTEVENVLRRHPKLTVVFAHFFFLSADLPRAAALFDRYEGTHFDLAPGIELLYNLSRDVPATRRFFESYADRILFGTDISGGQPPEEARLRAGIVTRWLETDEEYRVPEGADFLLGPPEDGIVRGISLSDDALAKIYHGNFERLAGARPKALNRELAAQECERIAAEVAVMAGTPVGDTEAAQSAVRLRRSGPPA